MFLIYNFNGIFKCKKKNFFTTMKALIQMEFLIVLKKLKFNFLKNLTFSFKFREKKKISFFI